MATASRGFRGQDKISADSDIVTGIFRRAVVVLYGHSGQRCVTGVGDLISISDHLPAVDHCPVRRDRHFYGRVNHVYCGSIGNASYPGGDLCRCLFGWQG